MAEVSNILQGSDNPDEEQLKKYLSGEGSAAENHEVEKSMADSDFINDAVEGLQAFSSQNKMNDFVSEINKNISQHLYERKIRKEKRKIGNLSWGIVAVIIILLLCILCFIVIKMLKEGEVDESSVNIRAHHELTVIKKPDLTL